MIKIIIVLFFQTLVIDAVSQSRTQILAVDHKDVIGTWQGHYEKGGINKSLTIEFREVNGQLECYMDIPDRGLKNAGFKINLCQAKDFHLERTSTDKTQFMDNTYIVFVGKPDGNNMTGHYKFGNSCSAGPAPSFSVTKTSSSQ